MTEHQIDDDLRAFAHKLFADEPDDQPGPPAPTRDPTEGTNTPTRITGQMRARDFVRRLFDENYDIFEPELPEERTIL